MHLHQQQQQNGLLVSLDTTESNGHYETSASSSLPLSSSSSSTAAAASVLQTNKKFLFKNSDIIFENDILQIGIKGEPTKSVLHVEFYYGNKTNFNLTNLSASISLADELDPGKR